MRGVGLPVERHRDCAAGFGVGGGAFEHLSGLGFAAIQRAVTGKGGYRYRRQKIFHHKVMAAGGAIARAVGQRSGNSVITIGQRCEIGRRNINTPATISPYGGAVMLTVNQHIDQFALFRSRRSP